MGKKILLADDSITIQKVIELTFSDEDFEVVTVGNGRLAIERLPEARPDLVLCDIIMPEKDGYEVCDFIKKTPSLAHIPVLLLTGAFEPFDQERAARVGCDGFLAKPFEPQMLIAKVKELLAQSALRPTPAPAAYTAPASAPAPSWPPASSPAAPAWSAAPSSPPVRPTPPVTQSISAPPPPPPVVVGDPEPVDDDDFSSGDSFGGTTSSGAGSGADIGTMRSPAFPAADDDPFGAAPKSLDELYDDDPYGADSGLLPLSDDEAQSVSPAPAPPRDEEPAPWAQPTVEVPLEMRAQAGVQSAQAAADGFEEVFEDEPVVAVSPFAASPPEPSAPSPAAPPTAFAAPPPARETPDSSFRDIAPAEQEDQMSISRSVAGEVNVPVDMVEKIAQRVVAQISEKVIREIAWEVIPDLAEALIKREIDRLKAELQQS